MSSVKTASQPDSQITRAPKKETISWEDQLAIETNAVAFSPGHDRAFVTRYYDTLARQGTYDQFLCDGRYNGPRYAADTVYQYMDHEDIRVLDVGAGTGQLGEMLHHRGLRNIDALEPSEGMLEVAKARGVYTNLYTEVLGEDNSSVKPDTYDVLVACGAMGEGHIPCSALPEMVRPVKPGGYVIIVMRESYLDIVADYRDCLEPLMKKLETEGVWERIQDTRVPKYFVDHTGIIYVFRVKVTGTKVFSVHDL